MIFYTLDHQILLNKLQYSGIRSTPLSYLSDSLQNVEMNNIKSEKQTITELSRFN